MGETERTCPSCGMEWAAIFGFCPIDGAPLGDGVALDQTIEAQAVEIDPWIGRTIDGRYHVRERIAVGGMAHVYRATHVRLGHELAIKLLLPGKANAEHQARFAREAQFAARLQHPGIVRVIDLGSLPDGGMYQVMELLGGADLDRVLESGPLPIDTAIELLARTADIVDALHEAGVVHRDLKPANLFVEGSGAVRLLDLGLARATAVDTRLTVAGATMGTASYMAPEQARGERDAGAAADIYGLGATFYHCITGQPPARGATILATLAQVIMGSPIPPSEIRPELPPGLDEVIARALAKEPEARYDTAADLADAARAAFAAPRISRPPSAPPEPARELRMLTVAVAEFEQTFEKTLAASQDDPTDEAIAQFREAMEAAGAQTEPLLGGRVVVVWGMAGAREEDPLIAIVSAYRFFNTFAFPSERWTVRIAVGAARERIEEGRRIGLSSLLQSGPASVLERTDDPGVHLDDATFRRVRTWISAVPNGGGWRVSSVVAGQAEPERVLGVETPFVGRDAELEQLLSCGVHVTKEGRPWLATVVGEPGLGRTRLLEAWRENVRAAPEVLWSAFAGAARPHGEEPFGLLRRLIEHRMKSGPIAPVAVEGAATGPSKILCVDDDPLALRSVARALSTAHDLVVETVQTPAEARERLLGGEYAVLLSDYEMPGENGIALIESIESRCDVVSVLLTGRAEVDVVLDALERGHIHAYVRKPCPTEELIATVRRAVERFEQGRAQHGPPADAGTPERRQALADALRYLWRTIGEEDEHLIANLLRLAPPRSPHLEALRSLPEEADRRTRRALLRLFVEAARRNPVYIVLDDVQWADEPSIDLLADVLEHARGPIFVICGTSPEGLARHAALFAARERHVRIDLAPLGRAAVRTLLERVLGGPPPSALEEALHQRAAGNPHFVAEYLHLLRERDILEPDDQGGWRMKAAPSELPMPENIEIAIQHRLDLLSRDQRRVLQRAAVVGEAFWDGALSALGELDPAETLRALIEQGILTTRARSQIPGSREVAFRQQATRDVVLARVPEAERRRQHETVARWALAEHSLPATFGASHLEAAGRVDEAARILVTTAEHARDTQTHAAAEAFAKHARDLATDPALALEAAFVLDDALRGLARTNERFEHLRPAQELAGKDGVAQQRVGLRWLEALYDLNDLGGSEQLIERFGEPLPGLPAGEATRFHVNAAATLVRLGKLDAAETHGTRALELASASGDARMEASALNRLGMLARRRHQMWDAAELQRRAASLATECGDQLLRARCLLSIADHVYQLGRFEEAVDAARVASEIDLGASEISMLAGLNLCRALALGERATEAMVVVRDVIARAREAEAGRSLAMGLAYEAEVLLDDRERHADLSDGEWAERWRLAGLPVDLGFRTRAIEALDAHYDESRDPETLLWAVYLSLRGSLREGDVDAACAAADRAAEGLAEAGSHECDVAILCLSAQARREAGDKKGATQIVGDALSRMRQRIEPIPRGPDRAEFLAMPWHQRAIEIAMAQRLTIHSALLEPAR